MENEPNELFSKPVIEEKNNSGKYIWPIVGLVVLIIVVYSIIAGVSSGTKEGEKESMTNSDKGSMMENTSSPKLDNLSSVTIVSDFGNTVTNGKISAFAQKKTVTKGKIKRGFLHVIASLGENKALDAYSDVYLKLGAVVDNDWKETGGHLIEKLSLEQIGQEDKTEILFDLTDVKYKESYLDTEDQIISSNWLDILNNSDRQFLTSFTSTESSGLIKEINIFYECEDGSDCSIEVSN